MQRHQERDTIHYINKRTIKTTNHNKRNLGGRRRPETGNETDKTINFNDETINRSLFTEAYRQMRVVDGGLRSRSRE